MLCGGAVPLIWIFWLMSWIVMLLPTTCIYFLPATKLLASSLINFVSHVKAY